jgi:hypothetical protein
VKYKVTVTWVVEVGEAEVRQAAKGYGREVDPRQLAVFKAVEKTLEVVSGQGQWDNTKTTFDVTEMTN